MELQLILAKQQDLKELNTGNVDEVKYPSVDVRQNEDKNPSLTKSERCMMEIIEKEVDAYKNSLQEKTMSGKNTSFTTSYLC